MSDSHLLYKVRGSVAWFTLNREQQRNSISTDMLDLFNEYLDRVENDPNIRVVAITGAGEKIFCSGADLGAALQSGGSNTGAQKYAELMKRLAAFPKPLVAKLNGHCLAGGMGLMLSCDMVYAHDAVKVGTPEVKVGLFPMMVCALLFKNASRKQALEMVYTAELLPAKEAADMGLITRAYAKEDFDDAVQSKLDAIAGNAPVAISIGRQALAEIDTMDFEEALDFLSSKLGDVLNTDDAAEGLAAFLQKRKPEWKGR